MSTLLGYGEVGLGSLAQDVDHGAHLLTVRDAASSIVSIAAC
jgi:hypothetical protein